MNGPVDEAADRGTPDPHGEVEIREGRVTSLGGLGISRVLPTKGRRTVGAWCFVDLMTPGDVMDPPRMEIGPHPHTGLATVTWLFAGTAEHTDSLGTVQLIRPGQLNLMTAGHGIAHAELGIEPSGLGQPAGAFTGAQMWIAQPEGTRHGAPRFEHIDEIPVAEFSGATGRVFVGAAAGVTSPASVDTALIGMDLILHPSTELPADPRFEYGIVPLDRPVKVGEAIVEPGSLALVPPGRDAIRLAVDGGAGRLLVLGGEPLGERVQMWWNFVARTKDEITDAWRAWLNRDEDRFGPVPSQLERIEPPTPPWIPVSER